MIQGNATGTGDGGGLYLIGNVGRVIIRRNLIVENHAADHGGGLYLANVFGGDPELLEVSGNVIIAERSTWGARKELLSRRWNLDCGRRQRPSQHSCLQHCGDDGGRLVGWRMLPPGDPSWDPCRVQYPLQELGRWDRLRRPFHRPAVPKSPIRQQPIRHRTP